MKKMKTLFTLLVSVLLTSNLVAQDTWGIVDKDMAAWDDNQFETSALGTRIDVNKAGTKGTTSITLAQNNNFEFLTQSPNFVTLKKVKTGTSASGYLQAVVGTATTNGNYVFEIKARINPVLQASAPDKGFECNEVKLRLANQTIQFFLKYGTEATGTNAGYISPAAKKEYDAADLEADPINTTSTAARQLATSTFRVYRIEFNATTQKYTVFVDGTAYLTDVTTGSTGNDLVAVGAGAPNTSTSYFCHMDVEYIRLKNTESGTWNVIDKYFDGWNGGKGWDVAGWQVSKGTNSTLTATASKNVESGVNYVNIQKTSTHAATGDQFYLITPSTANDKIGAVSMTDGAQTLEVKARIPAGSLATGNQIGARLFDETMAIILKDGVIAYANIHQTGIIPEETSEIPLNTSDWHNYRIILNPDKISYDVYIDGEIVYKNVATVKPATGNSIIKLGAESWATCDMDVASVKMATGAFGYTQTVDFTLPDEIVKSEEFSITPTSTGVYNPRYILYAKGESDEDYVELTPSSPSKYTLSTAGTYAFKVAVAVPTASGAMAVVAESDVQENVSVIATPTSINFVSSQKTIVKGGIASIQAGFGGSAVIEIYTINGSLLERTVAVDSFKKTGLASGLYIVKINGQVSKAIVK